ncbi:MAG: translation initiation factor IF-2 [Terriglobia bacterium]
MDQIRINLLARELEVKSRRILDYLPEIGVSDKKSHSSSVSDEIAEKVRAHFRALEDAEHEAARKEEQAKQAAQRAAAERTAAEHAAAARAAAERAAAEKAAEPAGLPLPEPRPPMVRPPVAGGARTLPQPAAVKREPRRAVAQPLAAATAPTMAEAPPGAPATRTAPAAIAAAPGAPARTTTPAPGRPIYERKPATRVRPPAKTHLERRFDEGERRLRHPVRPRTRPEPGERKVLLPAEAPPVRREAIAITITEGITVKELAEKLKVRAKDVIKALMNRGMLATINQSVDTKLVTELAQQFNATTSVISFEEESVQELVQEEAAKGERVARGPVVTVMGHVDHGKTSLLDALRETDVVAGESGGITQHIGASQVQVNGRKIVFIDTPGHEAFTRMRARGASVTDLVVLVVAADDGVMPQTLEAIDHARAAGVPLLVAVNKIDKPDAQPERVKKQLADRGLLPEDWGGDTVMVDVSATRKTNLELLLEMILLVADLKELRANPTQLSRGTVLESRLDRGRGPVATVLVQDGTLRLGDPFIVGSIFGKVRALLDDHGRPIKEAGPSTPVEVLGLTGLPEVGDPFQAVSDEVKAKQVASYREQKQREAELATSQRLTLDHLHEQLEAGAVKELPLVLKADVQGSVEALSGQLDRLSTDKVKIKLVHSGVGGISENDVLLASASNAVIVGFNVRPERKAADLAEQEGVDIRQHSVIYEVLEEIQKAAAGMLEPTLKETVVGRAEVRETFRIPRVGMVAGCYVLDGKMVRDAAVRVLRDNVVIYQSKLASLRRFKDDVKEVTSGYECGTTISNFSDVKVGDMLEVFAVERVASEVPA